MAGDRRSNDSLGAVSTLWTVVLDARDGAAAARQELCRRYHGAVERYLRAALPGAEAAELAQEFALKVLRGELGGATPERGRFRDYLKGVLRHLIIDYYRRPRREVQLDSAIPVAANPEGDPAALDREWTAGWRQELLNRAWAALADHQARTGQPVFDVLQFRSQNPELRSHEMTQPLGERLGKPVTSEWVRQNIHRARERFGELLLAEIADTIGDPAAAALEDELADLELLEYCQTALATWRRKGAGG